MLWRGADPENNAEGPMTLLLDVMGTLVYDPFDREIPAFFEMTKPELLEAKHREAWVRFERGEIGEKQFLDSFFTDEREFDQRGLIETVRESYRWIDGMEELLRALHDGGAKMHAFSNYPPWYQMIEERLTLSRYLDWSFVSCITGVRKPKPEAFESAAATLGVEPLECIFIDDREANVTAATEASMDGILFESAEQLRRELAKRGHDV